MYCYLFYVIPFLYSVQKVLKLKILEQSVNLVYKAYSPSCGTLEIMLFVRPTAKHGGLYSVYYHCLVTVPCPCQAPTQWRAPWRGAPPPPRCCSSLPSYLRWSASTRRRWSSRTETRWRMRTSWRSGDGGVVYTSTAVGGVVYTSTAVGGVVYISTAVGGVLYTFTAVGGGGVYWFTPPRL